MGNFKVLGIIFLLATLVLLTSCKNQIKLNVIDEHPRLMFRDSDWDGLTVEKIRERCKNPVYECYSVLENMDEKQSVSRDALRYVITKDYNLAESVKLRLLNHNFTCFDPNNEVVDLSGYSLAFDWIYNYKNFSTKDKEFVNKKIQNCAWKVNQQLGTCNPHLFHGRTQLSSNLMIASLAQDGDSDLLKEAEKKFLKDSLEAWAYLDGAWPEGITYLRNRMSSAKRMERSISDALLSIHSATGFTIFEYIKEEQNNWLERLGLFHIYMFRPDEQWSRFGDMPNRRLKSHGEQRRALEMIASVYSNGHVQKLVHELDFCNQSMHCFPYTKPLKYDASLNEKEWDELPEAIVFGKDTIGYSFIKSDWSPNQTYIQYVAGDWFTGHQHFASGSFTLFKGKPLAIDSGQYANWFTDHRENYYTRTIAHNALLICQPNETFNAYGSTKFTNDCGQRLLTKGGQNVKDLEQHEAEKTLSFFESMPSNKYKETGDMLNFLHDSSFDYINSDITKAYNSIYFEYGNNTPKVSLVTRQLIYLRDYDALIVFDRINSTNKSYEKKFLLHSINKPITENENVVEGDNENGIMETFDKYIIIKNNESYLFVKTLLPEQSKAKKIGGEDYKFYCDGKNRLIKPGDMKYPDYIWTEEGKWRVEVSPSKESYFDTFLHILIPRIEKGNNIETELVEGVNMQGLVANTTLVLFSKNGDVLEESNIKLDKNINRIIVVNVMPEQEYLIKLGNNNYNIKSDKDNILKVKFKEKHVSEVILRKLYK